MLLKYIQRPELEGWLEEILRLVWQWVEVASAASGVEALITVLRYIAEGREGLSEEALRMAVEAVAAGRGVVGGGDPSPRGDGGSKAVGGCAVDRSSGGESRGVRGSPGGV